MEPTSSRDRCSATCRLRSGAPAIIRFGRFGASPIAPWTASRRSWGGCHFGRPSIQPERLLRALLLQALHTIRSERQLMEQLDYNLLFRWFVGLGIDEAVWAPTTFTKNRDRLLDGDIAVVFFAAILIHADTERLLSDDHFTVEDASGRLRVANTSRVKRLSPEVERHHQLGKIG